MQNIILGAACALFVASFVNMVMAGKGWRSDATDRLNDKGKVVERSGLMVVTDHGTGVQYVVLPMAGMTVRVDKDGKPMVAGK
jgi:hypothetical protein